LYEVERPILVTDQHPDYFTTQLAREFHGESFEVQHHHAHLAAAMVEHRWLDREVLGVVWDGTGYGSDATVWGGEFLVGTASRFRRVAHLRPFGLFGGDKAIREPRRVAISLLADTFGADDAEQITQRLGWGSDQSRFAALSRKPQLGVVTTSAGRLFDAVASIVLGIDQAQFEGHPAMLLEAACDVAEGGCYPLPINDQQPPHLDWRSLVRSICDDVRCGVAPGTIAMRFHRALAAGIASVCRCYSHLPVTLCGGVFQNRILVELVVNELCNDKQPLGLPGVIPTNDGGLSAGQLAIALSRLGPDRHLAEK
jgi:hydrogenase maturation protein HypF